MNVREMRKVGVLKWNLFVDSIVLFKWILLNVIWKLSILIFVMIVSLIFDDFEDLIIELFVYNSIFIKNFMI